MSEEKEIWKDVPEYGGKYQVSTFGRFKSMYRKKYNSSEFVMKEKYYTLSAKENEYVYLTLFNANEQKTIALHQIVAITFLGHTRGKNKLCINHKDCNKHNNYLSNLEIVTYSENTKHAYRNGVIPIHTNKKGSLSYASREVFVYDLNKTFIKRYGSIAEASVELNISLNKISKILAGRTKNIKSYYFTYKLINFK